MVRKRPSKNPMRRHSEDLKRGGGARIRFAAVRGTVEGQSTPDLRDGKALFQPRMTSSGTTSPDYSTGVQEAPSIEAPSGGLDLAARVEAVLFAAPGPVEVGRLATVFERTAREIEAALETLQERYRTRGLALQSGRSGVQLTTSPQASVDVERFLEVETTSRLSRAALEVLAVIAYQQPVTRPQVDAIRGVNSESSIGTLMRYGLVEEVGRSDAPGRPFLYVTSPEFLQYFGLNSLDQLPPLHLRDSPEAGDSSDDSASLSENQGDV